MVIFSQLPVSSVYGCVFSTFLGALPPRSAKNTSWIWYYREKLVPLHPELLQASGFSKKLYPTPFGRIRQCIFLRKNFAVSENCRTFAAEWYLYIPDIRK